MKAKKILAVVLALALCIGCVSIVASAAATTATGTLDAAPKNMVTVSNWTTGALEFKEAQDWDSFTGITTSGKADVDKMVTEDQQFGFQSNDAKLAGTDTASIDEDGLFRLKNGEFDGYTEMLTCFYATTADDDENISQAIIGNNNPAINKETSGLYLPVEGSNFVFFVDNSDNENAISLAPTVYEEVYNEAGTKTSAMNSDCCWGTAAVDVAAGFKGWVTIPLADFTPQWVEYGCADNQTGFWCLKHINAVDWVITAPGSISDGGSYAIGKIGFTNIKFRVLDANFTGETAPENFVAIVDPTVEGFEIDKIKPADLNKTTPEGDTKPDGCWGDSNGVTADKHYIKYAWTAKDGQLLCNYDVACNTAYYFQALNLFEKILDDEGEEIIGTKDYVGCNTSLKLKAPVATGSADAGIAFYVDTTGATQIKADENGDPEVTDELMPAETTFNQFGIWLCTADMKDGKPYEKFEVKQQYTQFKNWAESSFPANYKGWIKVPFSEMSVVDWSNNTSDVDGNINLEAIQNIQFMVNTDYFTAGSVKFGKIGVYGVELAGNEGGSEGGSTGGGSNGGGTSNPNSGMNAATGIASGLAVAALAVAAAACFRKKND